MEFLTKTNNTTVTQALDRLLDANQTLSFPPTLCILWQRHRSQKPNTNPQHKQRVFHGSVYLPALASDIKPLLCFIIILYENHFGFLRPLKMLHFLPFPVLRGDLHCLSWLERRKCTFIIKLPFWVAWNAITWPFSKMCFSLSNLQRLANGTSSIWIRFKIQT